MLYIAVSGVSLVLCSGSFNVLRFALLMVDFVVGCWVYGCEVRILCSLCWCVVIVLPFYLLVRVWLLLLVLRCVECFVCVCFGFYGLVNCW